MSSESPPWGTGLPPWGTGTPPWGTGLPPWGTGPPPWVTARTSATMTGSMQVLTTAPPGSTDLPSESSSRTTTMVRSSGTAVTVISSIAPTTGAAAVQVASSGNDSAVKIGIAVGLAVGVLILIVLCIIAYALLRRRRKNKEAHEEEPSTASRTSSDVKPHEAPCDDAALYEMTSDRAHDVKPHEVHSDSVVVHEMASDHGARELEDPLSSKLAQDIKPEPALMKPEDNATSQPTAQNKEIDPKPVQRAELE